MIIALLLGAWAILGLIAMVGFGFVMTSWNKVADSMHRLDPPVRDAIGWPHRNLALVHLVWPVEGFRMWRVQLRTSLYGLPETERIPIETRVEARRYRRLTWTFAVPFLMPGLAIGLLAHEFLVFLLIIPLLMIAAAGTWPSSDAIEKYLDD